VPVDSVPVSDQLPAAPLLITAYAFVWIAAMFYVWSIWRRMNKVEDDMRALSQKLPRR
jgi:CcmD family protein